MELLACSALLLALAAALVSGQGYTGCKPVYVRWSKAALDKTSRVSGNYALEDCQKACTGQYHPANERYKFACSSFNFRQNPTKSSDQECELFRSDQLRDVDHDIVAREDFSFYRRYCVKTKKACKSLYQFDLVVDSYMEQSEISRKLPARTVEDCLANCLEETNFQCRSVSYNRTGFECHLSSHSRVSKPGKVKLNNNPNFRIDYYENNCLNDSFAFSHTCGPNGITVKVESKAPYTGALYGLYDFFTCRSEPKDSTQFDHFFAFPHVADNCSKSMKVQKEDMVLDVVLSADGVQPLYFLTDQDIVYQASCRNPLRSSGSELPQVDKGTTLGLRIDEATTTSTGPDIPWWKQTESTRNRLPPLRTVPFTSSPTQEPLTTKSSEPSGRLGARHSTGFGLDSSPSTTNDVLLFSNGPVQNSFPRSSGRGEMFETLMLLGFPDGSFDKKPTRNPSTPRVYRTRLRIDYGDSVFDSNQSVPYTEPTIIDSRITGYRIDTPLTVGSSRRQPNSEFGEKSTIRVFIPIRSDPPSSSTKTSTTTTTSTTKSTTTTTTEPPSTTRREGRVTKWWEAVGPSADSREATDRTTTTTEPTTTRTTKIPTRPTPWWWKKTLATEKPTTTRRGETTSTSRQSKTSPSTTTTSVPVTTTTTTTQAPTTTEPKQAVKMEIMSNDITASAVLVNSPITLHFSSSIPGRVKANQMSLISCQVEPTRSRFAYGPVELIENGFVFIPRTCHDSFITISHDLKSLDLEATPYEWNVCLWNLTEVSLNFSCSSDGVGLVEPIQQTLDGITVRMGPLRYTDSAETMYTCKVRVCKIQCPTFSCLGQDARPYISYGRRRRRQVAPRLGGSTSGIPNVPINFDNLRTNLPPKLAPNHRPTPSASLAFPSGTRGAQIPQSRFLNARGFQAAATPSRRNPLAVANGGLNTSPFFNGLTGGSASNAWANVDYEEIQLTQKLVVLNSQYALNYYLKTGLILPEEEQQFSSG